MIIENMSARIKLKVFLLLFISALLLGNAFGQTNAERHQQIRTAVDGGELKKALSDLGALRALNTPLFEANNYDYLQARLSQLSGDADTSTAAYQSVAARRSALSQYALWHLSQSARSIGDLVLERERLRQLIAIAPGSLLREGATLRLGESFFESADYPNAVMSLEPLQQSKNVATAREAGTLIAQSYSRQGKQAEAHSAFMKLIMQMPDASRPDDFALTAVRALDVPDANSTGTPTLTEADHLLRASIYQFNRDFSGARKHYLEII